MPEEIKFLMFKEKRVGLSPSFSKKFFDAEKPFWDAFEAGRKAAPTGKNAQGGKPLPAFTQGVRAELEEGIKRMLADKAKPREQRVGECLDEFFHKGYREHPGLKAALEEAAKQADEEGKASFIIAHHESDNPAWVWDPEAASRSESRQRRGHQFLDI
jgi:hypothetical protein